MKQHFCLKMIIKTDLEEEKLEEFGFLEDRTVEEFLDFLGYC
jgi:hypothetical protein